MCRRGCSGGSNPCPFLKWMKDDINELYYWCPHSFGIETLIQYESSSVGYKQETDTLFVSTIKTFYLQGPVFMLAEQFGHFHTSILHFLHSSVWDFAVKMNCWYPGGECVIDTSEPHLFLGQLLPFRWIYQQTKCSNHTCKNWIMPKM